MDGLVPVSLSWGIIFLTQTTAGILGNSFLLCLYVFSFLTSPSWRPINLIIKQLLLANNLVLFSKGIPHLLAALGLKAFLDTTGCKLVFYLHRVARGVLLSTASLLSGFQAFTLCSNISGWLDIRIRFPKYIGTCCFLCWILSLILNIYNIMYVTGPKNTKNMSIEKMYRFCFSPLPEQAVFLLITLIIIITDGTCLGLMAWSSGTMVLVLKRHKKRVQHIHSHSLSQKPCHENRATCAILILASMFVSFYSLSGILSLWITQTVNPSHWLLNISVLVSSGFPTFSPFVFIFVDPQVSQVCFVSRIRKANAPIIVPGL